MEQLLSVLDNALLQGLSYGVAVIGIAISFRVLRYPDLTADGSFLMGAAILGAALLAGWNWYLALLASACGGSLAGFVTATLHNRAGVNRLLSGILTSMICYSAAFWILSGRSNVNVTNSRTLFSAAEAMDMKAFWSESGVHLGSIGVSLLFVIIAVVCVVMLLKSDFGIVLRATGENDAMVEGLGRKPGRYYTVGLMFANGLIGLSGSLVASRQGFADVNMGFGVIITLVAALVIGEEVLRLFGLNPVTKLAGRALSGVVGACTYFLLYLAILRASIIGWIPIRIQPTDLKMMSALIVVVFVLIRRHTGSKTCTREEVLPI